LKPPTSYDLKLLQMDHFQDGDIAPLKDIWLAVEPYPSEKYDSSQLG
jgi:hypothetical protein